MYFENEHFFSKGCNLKCSNSLHDFILVSYVFINYQYFKRNYLISTSLLYQKQFSFLSVMEKSLFSSLQYFFVVNVVMHFIFQEEKTVDERDADRTAAKKYVFSVIFALDEHVCYPSDGSGYQEVVALC